MTADDEQRNDALRRLVRETRNAAKRLAKVSTKAERPQAGDLYVVPSLEHDVEWLVLGPDPRDRSRWRLVLVDLDPVAGCHDLSIEDEACGALTVRSVHQVLVPSALLGVIPRTGQVPVEHLERVEGLAREPCTDWAAEEAEATSRYRDRRRVCDRAVSSLQTMADTFERMGQTQQLAGTDAPLRRMLQWAAVFVIAVGSITLLTREGGSRQPLPEDVPLEPMVASAISLQQDELLRNRRHQPKVVRVGRHSYLPLTLLLVEGRPEAFYHVRVFSEDARSPFLVLTAEGREGSGEVSFWLPEASLPTGLIRLELEEDTPDGTVRTYRFVAEEDE